jgi:excisionase family DNA binding protein
MEVQTDKNLLTATEAARRLRISRASLSRLVRNNRIGVYRIGGRTMFDETLIDAFKESVYVEPREERQAVEEK